ncbi:hypothetical protein LXL04_037233 [Taraxacum kok-saghyz]
MISIDDHPPPDPSSSHHRRHLHRNRHNHQQEHHDLKVSDIDLKSPDVDDLHQLPNFSIRDYVLGLRSKDVACNWPFSPTSLQLCLKHGVKNLLPPFQSLDSLRNNSSVTRCSIDQNRLRDEETVITFHEKPRNHDHVKSNHEKVTVIVTANSIGSKRDNESQFQKSKEKPPAAASQTTENVKKSKSVMKLNQGVELLEEISMASKICPVCKVFSSSSNTTLNAHIDQCLTGDQGTMKWSIDHSPKVVVKHRVKPRKTRLMVEIYKTAPHCTIEELDRRNGTNWATNSSFPAQEFQGDEEEVEEVQEEEEHVEEARTMTTANRDVADNEGDVYIDTDGTKVRILSVPKSGNLDNNNNNNNHGNRKLFKGVKGGKFLMGKKKFKSDHHDHKQKHHKKYLKLTPNAKKLCLPKSQIVDEQARNCQEDDAAIAEDCSKDERPRNSMNNRLDDLVIVRPPWACSKRTNLAKRKLRKNLQLRIESDTSPPLSSDDVAASRSRKKTKTSSDDNDLGSPDSRNSDSFVMRSKGGSKFLRKNLSFPASNFINLKWKCSVNDTLDEDSSKENSRNEEHVAIRKNELTNSDTSSKSTSIEESSSDGVETADVDVESDRKETLTSSLPLPLPDVDQVCDLQAPNFTGLSNSFDPDFSKCVEMYQEQLLCSTNRAPDVEKHDLFFHEDDPIPIPGPPGSFLPPSPGGDMVSDHEQLQANSSSTTTTTTRVEIETHHNHDTVDRDSMSNSPVSTVSNPSNLARSDSRSTSFVHDQMLNTKSPTNFKNDHHQPCCCSRKDAAISYNQELNKNPSGGVNFRSDTFPLSNYSISQPPPETTIFPTVKKLPVYNDNCDSAVSPSKPVLRLMGKNLTVVKTDEDSPPPPPLPASQLFRPPPQLPQQPPVIFSQFQNGSESQRFNVYPPFQSHGGFMAPVDRYGHSGGSYPGHTNTVPHVRSHHGHNSNEIIIVDDLPDNDSMRNEIMRRNRGQVNPLYTMYHHGQSSGHLYSGGGGGGSAVFRGGSFNGELGKWDVGSSSSPSRTTSSHMRSSTSYYLPPSYP